MKNIKILIVDDMEDLLDLYEVVLDSKFDATILRATSSIEAIEALSSHENINLIISDLNMPEGNGDKIIYYNTQNNKIPFILCTSENIEALPKELKQEIENSNNYLYLQKPVASKDILFNVEKLLNAKIPSSEVEINSVTYKKIKIDFLTKFLNDNANIYLKLSDKKFLKIIHKNELQRESQLIKYQLRGESYAYITEDDYEEFISKLTVKLTQELEASSSFEDVVACASEGLEFINDSLKTLGISEPQKVYINKVVNKSIKHLSQNNDLSRLLKDFYKKKGYLVGHSLLIVHISQLMITKIPFSNTQQLEKITYAALIHDLSLGEDKLSMIVDKDISYEDLDHKEKSKIDEHVFESAKLINEMSFISPDVSKIIIEHHEKPDGSGFPKGLKSSQISPLSCIFILALRLSHFMIFNDYEKDGKSYLEFLKQNYNKGNFKNPLKALITALDS
ncbi:HD domain-containing phosphohydrolase [Halobacteriovorax sp. HLS]|uniref:HD domain-containing phosphohydrolase n=1 Tax=Halobacteriovorax sp. HLS TaxID=2234000 RepID=UPI000FD94247|nr:HD domain-containing phosphohydrolase [Halobacteriovorax sp. HLS]